MKKFIGYFLMCSPFLLLSGIAIEVMGLALGMAAAIIGSIVITILVVIGVSLIED